MPAHSIALPPRGSGMVTIMNIQLRIDDSIIETIKSDLTQKDLNLSINDLIRAFLVNRAMQIKDDNQRKTLARGP